MTTVLKDPIVPNPVNAAIDALKSGKSVEEAVYGEKSAAVSTSDSNSSNADEVLEGATDGSESTGDSQPSALDNVSDSTEATTAGDIEEIIITDDSGRKKVTVDWKDREKLKKYVQMAAGMRKYQVERDKVTAELSELKPKYDDLAQSWQAIEDAFSSNGIRGLINLLAGADDAYERHLQSEFQRVKARENATPSELERMDLEERLTSERREREKLARQVEENLKKATEKEEISSMKALESLVHPAFDKHRFAGKLGDEVVEAQLDQAVWDQALKRLEQYPESFELTPTVVEKEFREVSNAFRKIINKQAEQKAQKVVANKKVAAQEAAAAKAMNGYSPKTSPAAEKFKTDMKSGNLVSALTDFMTGRIKL
jgi:hypothetical protein